jgi:hypothetical protein
MTIESEIAAVPKKYWFIGGGALLLIFLYLRKRGQDRAAAASSATDGLIGALQLPGGLQYAPITSGVSGGVGANQDSGLPAVSANTLMLGDVATSSTQTPITAATIPGASSNVFTVKGPGGSTAQTDDYHDPIVGIYPDGTPKRQYMPYREQSEATLANIKAGTAAGDTSHLNAWMPWGNKDAAIISNKNAQPWHGALVPWSDGSGKT